MEVVEPLSLDMFKRCLDLVMGLVVMGLQWQCQVSGWTG